jgi:pimeloyl-ACP methyl ester carboxylesterase
LNPLHDVGTARIAVRTTGQGPPLLLVHGWPLSGLTFRKLVPELSRFFTCHVVDLPGAGETEWSEDHDFRFEGQAQALRRLLPLLGLDSCAVLAQDTRATIARRLAILEPARVRKLVLIDTEIPGHRPPWVREFQWSSHLPFSRATFRALLRSRRFLRSPMGFGGSFVDLDLIDGEFHRSFIQPLLDSPRRLEGQIRYLRGIDWKMVDSLAQEHRRIEAPVLFIWGEDDPTFPVARAREMTGQLPHCAGLIAIPRARLLVHEERPEAVCSHALAFLRA